MESLLARAFGQPRAPSAFAEKLSLAGVDPNTPEGQAFVRDLLTKPESSVNISNVVGGRQPLTKPTRNKVQDELRSAEESLRRTQRIRETFDPDMLTFLGKGEAAIAEFADRANVSSANQKTLLRKKRAFTQNVNREFNAYRKLITGAAASVQELESLKTAIINEDLSPSQFESAFNEYVSELERGIRIRREMLAEGIDVGAPEFGDEFDRRFLGERVTFEASPGTATTRPLPPRGTISFSELKP